MNKVCTVRTEFFGFIAFELLITFEPDSFYLFSDFEEKY